MASSVCASSAFAAVGLSSTRFKCNDYSSQKSGSIVGATKASFPGGRKLRLRKNAAPAGTPSGSVTVCVAADPDRPLCLPGDFGFDPLGLDIEMECTSRASALQMGNAGRCWHLHPRIPHKARILNTPSWYTAGEQEYFTDTTTLFIIELIFIGWAEGRRWADILKPGCVNTDPIFPNKKLTGTDVGYPGGLWFDPLGWGSGSPEKIRELRTKEIKNGRLAMLAVMGAWFQAIYTGTGPIDNLFAHLADPGHSTIFAYIKGLFVIHKRKSYSSVVDSEEFEPEALVESGVAHQKDNSVAKMGLEEAHRGWFN
ncbi:hypothetical protein TEA_005920 [Camellia sinensis var. sinensis]|uniref:Chlorophyll a-b binding protein, chloroplastic n=1 Tax=Camellia sinensis var. sinensis TaxID=542762 RepID=A0A4S4E6M2_CAMSN|nr:hypothetical protein TEA_005920 [Camellia sinensis var. sinensis]